MLSTARFASRQLSRRTLSRPLTGNTNSNTSAPGFSVKKAIESTVLLVGLLWLRPEQARITLFSHKHIGIVDLLEHDLQSRQHAVSGPMKTATSGGDRTAIGG